MNWLAPGNRVNIQTCGPRLLASDAPMRYVSGIVFPCFLFVIVG